MLPKDPQQCNEMNMPSAGHVVQLSTSRGGSTYRWDTLGTAIMLHTTAVVRAFIFILVSVTVLLKTVKHKQTVCGYAPPPAAGGRLR
jgi:hypothetical protein